MELHDLSPFVSPQWVEQHNPLPLCHKSKGRRPKRSDVGNSAHAASTGAGDWIFKRPLTDRRMVAAPNVENRARSMLPAVLHARNRQSPLIRQGRRNSVVARADGILRQPTSERGQALAKPTGVGIHYWHIAVLGDIKHPQVCHFFLKRRCLGNQMGG